MLNKNYTLFVNSSDGFEDCWEPFFLLLKKYWPPPYPQIILNTEKKDFTYDNLPIICTKVSEMTNQKMQWSECFLKGLDYVETDFILYLQEDYFINNLINIDDINYFVGVMSNSDKIDYLGLTNNGSTGPFFQTSDEKIWSISKHTLYKISCQAALWRKKSLYEYIKIDENAWMFEIFGSLRAGIKKDGYYTVNRQVYKNSPIISYLHTGIIKGKWNKDIVCDFDNNNIVIDYSVRGFNERKNGISLSLIKKTARKPSLLIKCIINWIIYKLKSKVNFNMSKNEFWE